MPRKKIINLMVLAVLAVTLPMAMFLAANTQLLTKKAAGEATVKVNLDPASGTKAKGEMFAVNVNFTNTGTIDQNVMAASVFIQFDPAVVTIGGIGSGSSPCNTTNFASAAYVGIHNDNMLEISCFRPQTNPVEATILTTNAVKTFASFTVTIKPEATASQAVLTLATAQVPKASEPATELAGVKEGATYTISGNATGGDGVVNFKVKLRDVDNRPASYYNGKSLNFKVAVTQTGTTPQFFTPQVVVNDQTISSDGIWIVGITGFNKTAGDYDVYIKGPKQLQKKFVKVPLTSVNNQAVDLTTRGAKYYLEGGDLPIGTNGAQDGVVNSIDATSLVNCLATPEEATCLSKADLNFDGQINSLDINLMNNTIYSRWEDELPQ